MINFRHQLMNLRTLPSLFTHTAVLTQHASGIAS